MQWQSASCNSDQAKSVGHEARTTPRYSSQPDLYRILSHHRRFGIRGSSQVVKKHVNLVTFGVRKRLEKS